MMSMNPDERAQVIERAAKALQDGKVVVLPTDTLYGVFVRSDENGAQLLDEITTHALNEAEPRFTLHLGDLDPILPLLDLRSGVSHRLVTLLLPGAARIVLNQPEFNIARVCEALGVPRGLIDNGVSIAIRVPDHPIARSVIRKSGVATIARQLGASRWGIEGNQGIDASMKSSSDDGHESIAEPSVVIDDGPTLYKHGSTTVRIDSKGGFTVEPTGPISENEVLGLLHTRVLFVCTGNTCRSAMAHAIARSLVHQLPPSGITISIDSAGVAAGDGYGASSQAVETLRERGIDLSSHQSKMVTPELIEQADVIYTMTPSHAQAVMQMGPTSVHKVFPLDASHPISDPIGHPVEVYRDVADQLERLIRQRLEEIVQ